MSWSGPTAAFDKHLNSPQQFKAFLNYALRQEVSDIFVQTGVPILAKVHGRLTALTQYELQKSQIERLLKDITSQDSLSAKLSAGSDYDHAFNIPCEIGKDRYGEPVQHRFRMNVTANYYNGDMGYQVVIRSIPAVPPSFEEITFPPELIPEISISQGSFIIAGETGSGKSTTFAACIRHILEGHTHITGNILTYEQPIEYLYYDIDSPCCTISQQEIGKNLGTFTDGIRNAMRRDPSLIVYGELRSEEEISSAIEACNTGHPFFATTHARTANDIIRRLTQKFEPTYQHQAFFDVVQSCKILMSQKLVPSTDGKRMCLRDWIILTPDLIEELMDVGPDRHAAFLKEHQNKGVGARTMLTSIRDAYETGRLARDVALRLVNDYGYAAEDLEG